MELKIQDLCKSYGKKKALWKFTTEFENGIYGILGPNGAGKSTLLNILTDNLLRDSGSVLYDGEEILNLGASYREIMGYMPQQQQLYEYLYGYTFYFLYGNAERDEEQGHPGKNGRAAPASESAKGKKEETERTFRWNEAAGAVAAGIAE